MRKCWKYKCSSRSWTMRIRMRSQPSHRPIRSMRVPMSHFKMVMSTFLLRSDQQKGECWCHFSIHIITIVSFDRKRNPLKCVCWRSKLNFGCERRFLRKRKNSISTFYRSFVKIDCICVESQTWHPYLRIKIPQECEKSSTWKLHIKLNLSQISHLSVLWATF